MNKSRKTEQQRRDKKEGIDRNAGVTQNIHSRRAVEKKVNRNHLKFKGRKEKLTLFCNFQSINQISSVLRSILLIRNHIQGIFISID